MTSELRDHFAAAALTGLLSASDANSWADDIWADDLCRTAFGWADAMLRERERTSVGVAGMDPVADRKSVATAGACASPCSQPFDSAPTTHDAAPAARAQVEAAGISRQGTGDTQTLTDEEREAIKAAIDRFRDWVNGTDDEGREVALRGLLERFK